MTHHRNILKRLAAVAAAAALLGVWTSSAWSCVRTTSGNSEQLVSCAGAQAPGSSLRRARASAHSVTWTRLQLDQLAQAYAQKNPGWVPPLASSATLPAQKTWTPEALARLAAAYSALNPGWIPPL